jgi:Bacterial Ig-like domain (group 1)
MENMMLRRVRHAGGALGAMIAIVATVAACGSDKSTGPDNTPASVSANGTFPASAVIASPVRPAPSVVVKNASGAPLPNVRVTFTVTSGGGLVDGPSQLTDANGIATVGDWTLGNTTGAQALTASAGGKTLVFSVNATNTCAITGTIAAGGTVNGNLSTTPCAMGDGTAAQSWTFQQGAGQSIVSFAMHSTGTPIFDTVLLLHRNTFTRFDNVIGFNDDDPAGVSTDSRLNAILGPGTYVLSGVNFDAGETGPFTISAESWSGEFANCEDFFVTPGITTNQTMTNSCAYTATGQYVDPVAIYLAQGERVQIDMTSAAFDPQLDLFLSGNTPVAQDDNGGGGTSARITYTAAASGIYVLVAGSHVAGQGGAYTLTTALVAPPPPPSGPATVSADVGARQLRAAKGGSAGFGRVASLWRRAQ